MKKAAIFLMFPLCLSACSTCYECTEEIIQYSGNTPVDTATQSDEFCTADQGEVEAREQEGADCRIN